MLKSALGAVALCSALLVCPSAFGADIFFNGRYANSAYDFAITVPPGFAFEAPETNRGVGASFKRKDDTGTLMVWGANDRVNNLQEIIDDLIGERRDEGWTMGPAETADDGVAANGTRSDQLIAIRLVPLCPDSYAGYELIYPADLRSAYAAALPEMNASFGSTQDIDCK